MNLDRISDAAFVFVGHCCVVESLDVRGRIVLRERSERLRDRCVWHPECRRRVGTLHVESTSEKFLNLLFLLFVQRRTAGVLFPIELTGA